MRRRNCVAGSQPSTLLPHCRYTSVAEVLIKPNPKGASSPQVQKDAEAEKVSQLQQQQQHMHEN
jgi:hypothetical protein